jgi:hypothetical protein
MSTATLTPKRKELFLEALRQHGNISKAARACGIQRSGVYEWRDQDEAFAARWEDAIEEAGDVLEDELFRRAVEGVTEPVFYKGEICGAVRKRSDTCLIFALKGAKPEKYRESFAVNATAVAAVTDKDTEAELREALDKVLSRSSSDDTTEDWDF